MSFGDQSSPLSSIMNQVTSRFDSVFGSAFGKGVGGGSDTTPAPTTPKSLITDPTQQDTPGRHKTLLGVQ